MAKVTPLSRPAESAQLNPRSEQVRLFFERTASVEPDLRQKQIDRYEAHYCGTQYSHLEYDWWGHNADALETVSPKVQVPVGWEQPAVGLSVRAMRPTSPLNLCTAVVNRFTGLLFSEKRKPSIVVEGDEDTQSTLSAVMDQCQFWTKMRQARAVGGSCGASMITAHLGNGEFSLEVHNPKHLHVLWANRSKLVPEAVLKQYVYSQMEPVMHPRKNEVVGMEEVKYLYRRIISTDEDTIFEPVKLDKNPDMTWRPMEGCSVRHGLGFFPGVWIQNLPPIDNSIEGYPDCHGGWQMLDTMDRLVSQMNKGVLLNLDPTLVLSYDPSEVARMGGVRKGSDNALNVGKSGSAKYLEITGQGIAAGEKLYERIKGAFLDLVRCVFVDPATISGAAQSARAIEYLYAPMIEKADDLRAQYGERGVVALLGVIDRIIRALDKKQIGEVDGRRVVTHINLPPRSVEGERGPERVPHVMGPGGRIALNWGPYFSPTENDNNLRINNAAAAKGGGLIDHRSAVEYTAGIFGIKDVDAELDAILEEREQELASVMPPGFDPAIPAPPEMDDAEDSTPAPERSGGRP